MALLVTFFMENFQTPLNKGGDKGDTASVDFSIGNVLRCMCFSHDDPLEPKKQLVKISATLDDVSKRLNKIESSSKNYGLSRRNSSIRGGAFNKRSLGNVHEVRKLQNNVC